MHGRSFDPFDGYDKVKQIAEDYNLLLLHNAGFAWFPTLGDARRFQMAVLRLFPRARILSERGIGGRVGVSLFGRELPSVTRARRQHAHARALAPRRS